MGANQQEGFPGQDWSPMDYYNVPQDQSPLDYFGIPQGQDQGGDRLNALLDNPDLRVGPGNFGGQGGQGGQGGAEPAVDPTQVEMFKRALQKGEERRARLQQGRQGGLNAADQVYAQTAGNLLGGFDASQRMVDDVNRGWEGVQNAYNVQANARAGVRIAEINAAAEREIAQKKYNTQESIANRILPSQLFGLDPSKLTGFEANTGGSLRLPQRSQFRRFSPRR